jgi:hypothetical protein
METSGHDNQHQNRANYSNLEQPKQRTMRAIALKYLQWREVHVRVLSTQAVG